MGRPTLCNRLEVPTIQIFYLCDPGHPLSVSDDWSPFVSISYCRPPDYRSLPPEPRPVVRKLDSRQATAGVLEEQAGEPSQDGDVGQFITSISPQPICINGGFGDIFKGIHKTVGEVALKRPRIGGTGHEELVIQRFRREADTWRRLKHPHILKFVGTYIYETHLHLVSPFMKNGTLMEYVRYRSGVNRVRLLCEAASAIDYLHQTSIVHGDIKASNLLISDDGHVLLCDFGLTKAMCAHTSPALKGAGAVRWQSPELWDGAPKTFESDVYAFSMTIAEVLTGFPPFPHLQLEMAVMKAVDNRNERPDKIPMECNGVSYENAWKVAERCWPRLPEERIPISDVLHRLKEDPSLV